VHALFAALRQPVDQVPDYFYADVGRQLRREREFIQRALLRGAPIIPQLERALEAKKMPPLLHYVALIESGYRSEARSRQGAVGLWQLMLPTARDYGLEVSGSVDERVDVARSSDAAAHYLQHLVFEFGSDALLLALAGYNAGQGQVRAKLKQLEDPFSDRSYWKLVETGLLPEETALYVTRFVAAAIAGEAGIPDREVLMAAGY
jgi:membrane-bound lytic murein transglycosylase D